jgi:hypothetical protein
LDIAGVPPMKIVLVVLVLEEKPRTTMDRGLTA